MTSITSSLLKLPQGNAYGQSSSGATSTTSSTTTSSTTTTETQPTAQTQPAAETQPATQTQTVSEPTATQPTEESAAVVIQSDPGATAPAPATSYAAPTVQIDAKPAEDAEVEAKVAERKAPEFDYSDFRGQAALQTLKGVNQQLADHEAKVREEADETEADQTEEPPRPEIRAYWNTIGMEEDGRPGQAFTAEL